MAYEFVVRGWREYGDTTVYRGRPDVPSNQVEMVLVETWDDQTGDQKFLWVRSMQLPFDRWQEWYDEIVDSLVDNYGFELA